MFHLRWVNLWIEEFWIQRSLGRRGILERYWRLLAGTDTQLHSSESKPHVLNSQPEPTRCLSAIPKKARDRCNHKDSPRGKEALHGDSQPWNPKAAVLEGYSAHCFFLSEHVSGSCR